MPLEIGTRIGPYQILSTLGAGGMGEVYRARDSNLNRTVAIKVLLPAFAADPERLARFRREAQLLAALNHPNIAQIHGLEDTGTLRAIVMELVEGPTLAERIEQGPLPAEDAQPIAKRIGEALQAAHEQGIIHRDLKPANIKVRDDGTVKVLDFGLAKALEGASGELAADNINSPTITSPAMTAHGVILGTAAYMSPEQAKGRLADKRSDVWAFGCVLYEMLTGKRAFEAEGVTESLAAVLKDDPDWSALPSNLPGAVNVLIQGCLRKDRQERIADISTALFLLQHPHALPSRAPARRKPAWWQWAVAFGAGALVVSAAAALLPTRTTSPSRPAVTRFAIAFPPSSQFSLARQAVALSPDGSRLVYAADGRLFLRTLSEIESRPIVGTELAMHPTFSPDGQSVVYWTASVLRRVAVSGGSPVTIGPAISPPSGIAWQNDTILFAQLGTGILSISANGGKPQVLVSVSADELAHGPQLLPDGRTLLFTLTRRVGAGADPWQQAHIVVESLSTRQRRTLIEGGTDARYVPTGHIVYMRGGTLYAVSFDAEKVAVTGTPVPLIEGVRRVFIAPIGSGHFAFSESGSIAYLPGSPSGLQQNLILFDRQGVEQVLEVPASAYGYPRVSPDGKRLALEISDGNETNIAIHDLSGAASLRRLTFGGNNRYPIWSADGRQVAFQSDREGDLAIFVQPADGGRAERLTRPEAGSMHVPESWSPKGDAFLFGVAKGGDMSLSLFAIRDRTATPFSNVRSKVLPTNAAFSPDGHWVAYHTAESDRTVATTFVEPFPPNGTKYQIARGAHPQWSRDGTELFYVPAPGQFKAVAITTRTAFTIGKPVDIPRRFGLADPGSPRPYDITPDGRFLGFTIEGQTQPGAAGPAEIHVVLNWFEELTARAPKN